MGDLLRSGFREKRFSEFVSYLGVGRQDRILDIGGAVHTWQGTGFERQVTLVNLGKRPNLSEGMEFIRGDACELSSIADGAFDVVFSNSVIEHVGDYARQKKMAEEVARVGKRYWVQTPNKHFPLEVHFMFPGFQYLPRGARHTVARLWPFSFSKFLGLDPLVEADHIWPIDFEHMRQLFPRATILKESFLGLTKSLIAVHR